MADTLEIFGVEYTNVTGIIAKDDNGTDLTFTRGGGSPTLQTKTKTYTPTESAQTEIVSADSGYDGINTVSISVGAISSTYVGTGITRRSSTDLTASGATVTVPSGYYSAQASKSVASGTAGTPTATKGTVSNHSVAVTPSVTNTSGYITGSTKTGTAVTVSVSELVSGTYTVDSSGTKDVTNYASASVPAGTAGTPSASKGTVSNHSVSVTPSVTNTTGWITGSTKTGTAVTVTASELASGNKAITQNGTDIDVVGYSTVSVDVQGGGGSGGLEYETGTLTLSSDESTPIISFANTHTDVPIYINITDVTETLATDNSNLYWTFMNWYTLNDSFIKTTSSSNMYGRYQYGWKTSSGTSAGNIDCTNTGTGSGSLYYLVTEDRFGPYCGSTNRYWRAGRTYKWIAVWAPTA